MQLRQRRGLKESSNCGSASNDKTAAGELGSAAGRGAGSGACAGWLGRTCTGSGAASGGRSSGSIRGLFSNAAGVG